MTTNGLEFFLYGRENCRLCDEMKQALAGFMSAKPYACHSINIDGDPALQQRFGARIPVLVSGGRELCEARLNQTTLSEYLESLALSGSP